MLKNIDFKKLVSRGGGKMSNETSYLLFLIVPYPVISTFGEGGHV
ncbi:hypothetical protein [Carnobacterium maltaromaticum]|nr:hypothetical protein [Carnobacterium maltaromaticum]